VKFDFPSPHVSCYRVCYRGFDDTPIRGWLLIPAFGPQEKIPCLVHYHGYAATSGRPADHLSWIMMGLAVLAPDHRDQNGDTGDLSGYSAGHMFNPYSKGLLDKREYYLGKVYMDAVKAVDFACAQPEIDASRVIVEGGSMGGGTSLAVAALDDRPFLCLADVPSHCHLDQRLADGTGSFGAVADYLKSHPGEVDKALETLSYFDIMNMAHRIRADVFASVGLKDPVCPAQCFFAAYNRISAPKEVRGYPFNGHEGGGSVHHEAKMRFVANRLKPE
jgi:cephalosporin-C deacetylase